MGEAAPVIDRETHDFPSMEELHQAPARERQPRDTGDGTWAGKSAVARSGSAARPIVLRTCAPIRALADLLSSGSRNQRTYAEPHSQSALRVLERRHPEA